MAHTRFQVDEFALVQIRDPKTNKFVVVEETKGRGLWLVGGHVDAGEDFMSAAVREAREEAGIDVVLKGIIRVEHTVRGSDKARMRVIFYAEPADPAATLKSIPDDESLGAFWASIEELEVLNKEKKLRDSALIEFAKYIANGGPVYPMSLLSIEWDEIKIPEQATVALSGLAPASDTTRAE